MKERKDEENKIDRYEEEVELEKEMMDNKGQEGGAGQGGGQVGQEEQQEENERHLKEGETCEGRQRGGNG